MTDKWRNKDGPIPDAWWDSELKMGKTPLTPEMDDYLKAEVAKADAILLEKLKG